MSETFVLIPRLLIEKQNSKKNLNTLKKRKQKDLREMTLG